MTTMTESANQRRISELAGLRVARVAKHLPTNRSYEVVLVIPNTCAHLKDMEGHDVTVRWADWINSEIWRVMP